MKPDILRYLFFWLISARYLSRSSHNPKSPIICFPVNPTHDHEKRRYTRIQPWFKSPYMDLKAIPNCPLVNKDWWSSLKLMLWVTLRNRRWLTGPEENCEVACGVSYSRVLLSASPSRASARDRGSWLRTAHQKGKRTFFYRRYSHFSIFFFCINVCVNLNSVGRLQQ